MDSRKVIRHHDSYYINIPSEICAELGIIEGDRLEISYLPGVGVIITQDGGPDKIPGNYESIKRLQRAADAIYSELQKKGKDLGDKFIPELIARLVPALAASGVLDLKWRVEKLEMNGEVPEQRRAKIHLVKKSDKGDE